MKKLFSLLAVVLLFISCSGRPSDRTIALLLPDGNINPKWNTDAACITKAVSAYGYTVETYMADDSEEGAQEQVRQLEQVLADGVKTVILTSIDYDAINRSGVLEKYPDINLISYDSLLMDSPYVDIFVGCNPFDIGKMHAHYILETFKAMGVTPKTLEVIAGPSRDINAVEFYRGAYSLFCPNDNVSDGVIQALKEYGCTLEDFPVVTGLDNVGVSAQYILDGYQSITIDKSLQSIADNVAVAVNGFMCGSPVKPSFSFNNGIADIPALFSNFSIITRDDLL